MSCKSGCTNQPSSVIWLQLIKTKSSSLFSSALIFSFFFLFLTGTSFKILVPFISQFAAFALPKAK